LLSMHEAKDEAEARAELIATFGGKGRVAMLVSGVYAPETRTADDFGTTARRVRPPEWTAFLRK